MTSRRTSPYVWTTWLSKLLVGDQSCEWAAWFKAHHQGFAKVPCSFDAAGWKLAHTELLVITRRQLKEEGKAITVEAQNWFRLAGKCATLGGKPDLIGLDGSGTICDVKTGQPKASDQVQVMIYMFAVPLALSKFARVRFDGLLVYPGHRVEIPAQAVDAAFIANLAGLIKRVGADSPARRVPSVGECMFCDLTSKDCAERVEAGSEELLTTSVF